MYYEVRRESSVLINDNGEVFVTVRATICMKSFSAPNHISKESIPNLRYPSLQRYAHIVNLLQRISWPPPADRNSEKGMAPRNIPHLDNFPYYSIYFVSQGISSFV